MTTTKFHIPYN